MSRDPELPDEEPPGPEPEGHLSTTRPGVLVGFALAGLLLGRLVRPVAVWLDLAAPRVGWLQVASLYFVAAVVGWVAWVTHRTQQRRDQGLRSHEAVNRLVLAKAVALAGAAVAGGYLGYTLSWAGDAAELAGERVVLSLVAAGGAALSVTGSLLLERACRVRGGPDQP